MRRRAVVVEAVVAVVFALLCVRIAPPSAGGASCGPSWTGPNPGLNTPAG